MRKTDETEQFDGATEFIYGDATFKSPRSGVTLCFLFVSASAGASTGASTAATTFTSQNLRYLGQRNYKSGKIHWITLPWLLSKVIGVTLINKICLHDLMTTTHPITTKLCSYIPLVMHITRLNLGELCFWRFKNKLHLFVSRSNPLLAIY